MKRVDWKCPACGFSARPRLFPVHCVCGFVQYQHPAALGDRVAAWLAWIGVTSKRYKRLKRAVGLKENCKCSERQQAINRWWARCAKLLRR